MEREYGTEIIVSERQAAENQYRKELRQQKEYSIEQSPGYVENK